MFPNVPMLSVETSQPIHLATSESSSEGRSLPIAPIILKTSTELIKTKNGNILHPHDLFAYWIEFGDEG